MTDPQLRGIAVQAFNMAVADLERDQGFSFLLGVVADGVRLQRLRHVERAINERVGSGWLDIPSDKDFVFAALRKMIDRGKPDAVAFVTAGNAFLPTEKLLALPEQEQRNLVEKGHEHHHRAVKQGLLTIHDALVCVVQTPERVCFYVRLRDSEAPPQINFCAQADLDGRLKMYGEGTPHE